MPRVTEPAERVRELVDEPPYARAPQGPTTTPQPSSAPRGAGPHVTPHGGFNSPAPRVCFTRRYARRSLRDQGMPESRARKGPRMLPRVTEPAKRVRELVARLSPSQPSPASTPCPSRGGRSTPAPKDLARVGPTRSPRRPPRPPPARRGSAASVWPRRWWRSTAAMRSCISPRDHPCRDLSPIRSRPTR